MTAMTGPVPPRTMSALAGLWAWLGLVLLCAFLLTKVEFSTEGTGRVLLPCVAACAAISVAMRRSDGARIRASRTFFAMLLFACYFMLRLLLDSEDASDLAGFTMGSSNGVVIALALGTTCRVLVDAATAAGRPMFRWTCCMGFIAIELLQFAAIARDAVDQRITDRQLLVVTNPTYQESGFLLSCMAILVGAVIVVTRPDSKGIAGRVLRSVHVSMAGLYFASSAVLAQFLGSNAGPAFIGPLGVACIGCLLVDVGCRGVRNVPPVSGGTEPTRFRSVVARALAWSAAIAAGLGALFTAAVLLAWIDIGRLRIFEFGARTLLGSSVTARWDILVDNYWTHQCHSPIFGQMFVDRLTTGGGTYVHSLLSLLPHLGLVGAMAFVYLCVQAAAQLRADWRYGWHGTGAARLVVFAALVLAWAVLFTAIANFFTAVQLWFSLGLLVPPMRITMAPSRLRAMPGHAPSAVPSCRWSPPRADSPDFARPRQ
jgi:hypothetical protein